MSFTPFEKIAIESFLAEGQIDMKEENIVRYTRDHLPEDTESDMAQVESMTEADIEEAARSDPDAQPTDDKFLSKAQIVLSIPLDQDTFKWYQNRGKTSKQQSVLCSMNTKRCIKSLDLRLGQGYEKIKSVCYLNRRFFYPRFLLHWRYSSYSGNAGASINAQSSWHLPQ